VRIGVVWWVTIGAFVVACASVPVAGPVGDGPAHPRITAVDTMYPPRSAWIEMDQPGNAVLVLVAPGHSATLLYPRDSVTSNWLTAGTHQLTFQIPDLLVQSDTSRNAARRGRQQPDSALRNPGGARTTARPSRPPPVPAATETYLLLLTSPQSLSYQRIVEKTAGVSIPSIETEALNAVAKAIKATIPSEPREISGYYQHIQLRRPR
jgi:hypothetical protein